MKSATDTTPSIPMSLIILGAPGTGKTTLATQFPKAYFLNADNNIEGSIRWLKDNNRNADFFYDDISSATKEELSKANIPDLELKDLPTEGECIVKRQWKYRYMAMLLNEAVGSDKIKTIVLDSLTSLTEVTLDEVRRQAGRAMGDPFGAKTVDDMLQRQDWGANMSLVKNLIFQLMGSGKRLVLIGHLKIDKDELTGIMQEYIAIPGQLSTQIALWFQEVWLLSFKDEIKANKKVRTRMIQTQPNNNQGKLGLKSSVGLAPEEPMEIDKIIEKIS